MKKLRGILFAVICVVLVVGCFYYVSHKETSAASEDVELTEVQKVITKDLSKNYPETPREVVKAYNRIISCFYNEEYTEDELYKLGDQARVLFDDELLQNNPRDEYFENLKEDIADYEENKRTLASTSVSSSNDVQYKTVDGDECAYVQASYFIKEGSSYKRTYQMYVLRKDEDGCWKILVFYQVEGDSSNE